MQIELADRTISGWLEGLEETLPLRSVEKDHQSRKPDTDLTSFHNMNALIERTREHELKQHDRKHTYLHKFKEYLIDECGLGELEELGEWCLSQWEEMKASQTRRTLNLRELHEEQARTPEHAMYRT